MLACVFLYTLSLHLSFSMMRLTLSLDALNHGAGGTEVGILIGLISLCPMLAALKYGRWVDAVGPRKPVCFGALCISVRRSFRLWPQPTLSVSFPFTAVRW